MLALAVLSKLLAYLLQNRDKITSYQTSYIFKLISSMELSPNILKN